MLKSLQKAVGLIAAAFLIGAASISPALAGDNKLPGTWTVTVTPEGAPFAVPNMTTISADGTVDNADPTFGAGHGVWEKVGANQYATSFRHYIDPSLSPVPPTAPGFVSLTVDGVTSLDASGDVASGPFQTTFRDSAGVILLQFGGEVELTRYKLPDDVSLFGEFFMANRQNKKN